MFKSKTIKKSVYWCSDCNQEIVGNGSMINPYRCKCGEYEFKDFNEDYKLKLN